MDNKQDLSLVGQSTAELNDVQILGYLKQNPQFFIRNADWVSEMQLAHPVRGAISLLEWYMSRQRHRIEVLEQDITWLIELAQTNESLYNNLLKLLMSLFAATSLDDFLQRLSSWAKSFGLSYCHIRLFQDRWQLSPPRIHQELALSQARFDPIRIHRFGDKNHYLGRLNGSEIATLIPHATVVGSVAVSLLGTQSDLGLLIFVSRDKFHYQDNMGTALLEKLADLIPQLLTRWISLA